MSKSIPTDNIVTTLDLAARADAFPDHPGSETKIRDGEKVYGEIKSPTTRVIWTSSTATCNVLNALREEHDKLHNRPCGTEPAEHDCKQFVESATALASRLKILTNLRWQAMHEEYPESFGCNVGLRDGWQFVRMANDDDHVRAALADHNPTSLLKTVAARIFDIFRDEGDDADAGTDIGTIEANDTVVCTITDARIKSLFRLRDQIHAEGVGMLPPGLPPFQEGNHEEVMGALRAWSENKTVKEVLSLRVATTKLQGAQDLVNNLFWRCVRDTYPKAATPEEIGVRDGWKIVIPEPDPAEESPSATMFEVIPVSAGSDLARILGIK